MRHCENRAGSRWGQWSNKAIQQPLSEQSRLCSRGSSTHLSPDALIHHLPITQDPAFGCPTIIVFYRFWLWSDAKISLVNGAAQRQWVYLYKYFIKKGLGIMTIFEFLILIEPCPPTPQSTPRTLLLRMPVCRLMWTINACTYPKVWLQLNWRERGKKTNTSVALLSSL